MTDNGKEINFFAKTNYRNKERIFGIKTDDRRRHMYVIGKTGMGKTTLIQNMAIQDIRNGKGMAVIDPHGEFAEECLKAVPKNRINDVIYFNPADTEFPIAMNIMEKVAPEYRHLVASGLVGVFKKLWADSWGPRLEYILRNAILALLEYPSSTLLAVNRLLVDKAYREKVIDNVTDPVVRSFWRDEFAKYQDRLLTEAIAPIQNKVGQFLSSSLIRNLVGQTRSSFSVREVMDQGKILIMNLSKGRIGEDNSALLGAMMITKIQLAAMGRVDIEEKDRRDFYLYVDEFQNFATDSFAGILSEARKYHLNLILAHQFIAQLEEKVSDAVFGNVGTLVTFRIGAADAEFLEKEFEPIFYINDLVNLNKYNVYLKLMIDGVATNPFSATSINPIDLAPTEENLEKVIRVSRERYGTSKIVVEDKINRWSGVVSPEVKSRIDQLARKFSSEGGAPNSAERALPQGENRKFQPEPRKENTFPGRENQRNDTQRKFSESRREEGGEKMTPNGRNKESENRSAGNDVPPQDRSMFDTKCWGCEVEIKVPFQPDGKRPVFCKDCLKNYRRKQANIETRNSAGEAGNDRGEFSQSRPSQANDQERVNRNEQKRAGGGEKINQEEVRDLIKKALEKNNNSIKLSDDKF